MLSFKKVNVNPKNRKTGDCSTRALAYALGISWADALDLQVEQAKKTGYDVTSHQVIERVLKKYGYEKMKQPRKSNNTKYEVRELDRWFTTVETGEPIVVQVAHHYVVVDGSNYVDSWDSGYKCAGNYYIKR